MRNRVSHHFLASGVRPDIEQMLSDFTMLNSLRYEDFAGLWRKRNISFIFCGRDSEMELREFTEDMLRMTADFLLPPFSFQVQVGAIYLLYGLYFKQPNNPRSRIRLTTPMWDHVHSLLAEIWSQQHLDVFFTFLKLEHARAFDFTAHTTQTAPLCMKPVDVEVQEQSEEQRQHLLTLDRPVLSEVMNLAELDNIHQHYHNMKVAIGPEGKNQPHSSLKVIETDIIQNITQMIDKHERWRTHKIQGTPLDKDDNESANVNGTSAAMGTRRARLKERAFQSVPQTGWRMRNTDKAAAQESLSLETGSVGSASECKYEDAVTSSEEDYEEKQIKSSSPKKAKKNKPQSDSTDGIKSAGRGKGRGRGRGGRGRRRGRGRGLKSN